MDGAYRSRADARLLRGDGSPGVARGIGSVSHSRSCRVSLIDVPGPAAHRRSGWIAAKPKSEVLRYQSAVARPRAPAQMPAVALAPGLTMPSTGPHRPIGRFV